MSDPPGRSKPALLKYCLGMNGFLVRRAALLLVALAASAAVLAGCGSDGETAKAERQERDAAPKQESHQEASVEYERYLVGEAAAMLKWTQELKDEIARGDQFGATFKYTNSRVYYGHLRTAVGLYPGLEKRINNAYDQIERILFGEETARGLKPLASRLVADVRRLRRALERTTMRPLSIVEASQRLMEEVSGRMIHGREAPYSRRDLVDVSASVEGAEEAFAVVMPSLMDRDPRLVAQIEKQFAKSFEHIDERGDPARDAHGPEAGTFFVSFLYMKPLYIRKIAEPLASVTRLYGMAVRRLEGS
jgi:iron uptake system EfeUOB component EfeO/EfeM